MERETRLFEEGGGERGPSGALRGLVYRGFRCGGTNGFALFDIRHDFIKHSSNVQTLYIELYSRPSPIWTSPAHGFARLRTLSTPEIGYVLLSGGAAYNENIGGAAISNNV